MACLVATLATRRRGMWWWLLATTTSGFLHPQPPVQMRRLYASAEEEALRTELRTLKVKELREALGQRNIRWATFLEKEDYVRALAAAKVAEGNFCKSGRVMPGKVAELSGAELQEEIQDVSSPMLVDVYARWCGPCQLMAPELVKAAEQMPNVRVVKVRYFFSELFRVFGGIFFILKIFFPLSKQSDSCRWIRTSNRSCRRR